MLGEDTETKPGPNLVQIAGELKGIAADIKDIKEKRLVDIETKLGALTIMERKLDACENQVISMNRMIETLEKSIDNIENRSRRSNLIAYGILEVEGETNEVLEDTVKRKIVQHMLGLEAVTTGRVHRLGKA